MFFFNILFTHQPTLDFNMPRKPLAQAKDEIKKQIENARKKLKGLENKRITEIGLLAKKQGVLDFDNQNFINAFQLMKNTKNDNQHTDQKTEAKA